MNKIIMDKKVIEIKDNERVVVNIDNLKYNNVTYNLGNNSVLIINKLYKEISIDEEVTINLNGYNSKIEYNFGILSNSDSKCVININHNNLNTISNVINHGVVLNNSKLDIVVNSYVKKGNKGSILKQSSKIIVMKENNSTIKPNLFIDEYDVEASHAATIGKFNNEDIFYLKTKGIDIDNIYKLLIDGFLNGHMNKEV